MLQRHRKPKGANQSIETVRGCQSARLFFREIQSQWQPSQSVPFDRLSSVIRLVWIGTRRHAMIGDDLDEHSALCRAQATGDIKEGSPFHVVQRTWFRMLLNSVNGSQTLGGRDIKDLNRISSPFGMRRRSDERLGRRQSQCPDALQSLY